MRDERVSNNKHQEVPLMLHIFTLLTCHQHSTGKLSSAGEGFLLLAPDAFGTTRLFGVRAGKKYRTRCGDQGNYHVDLMLSSLELANIRCFPT